MTGLLAMTTGDTFSVVFLLGFCLCAVAFAIWFDGFTCRLSMKRLAEAIEQAERDGLGDRPLVVSARDLLKRSAAAYARKDNNEAAELAAYGRGQMECLRMR